MIIKFHFVFQENSFYYIYTLTYHNFYKSIFLTKFPGVWKVKRKRKKKERCPVKRAFNIPILL